VRKAGAACRKPRRLPFSFGANPFFCKSNPARSSRSTGRASGGCNQFLGLGFLIETRFAGAHTSSKAKIAILQKPTYGALRDEETKGQARRVS